MRSLLGRCILLLLMESDHCSLLPSNVEFHKLDITQALPFEDETFDIVHARLVLMHVSRLSLTGRLDKP